MPLHKWLVAAMVGPGGVVLDGVVGQVLEYVASAELGGPGEYAASPGGSEADLYGSADAAAIRYVLGDFPADGVTRDQWVAHLRSFQDPDGAFRHTSHNAFHTTAQAVGALNLFDALPNQRLTFLEPLLAEGGIEALLEELDWSQPWMGSWTGAGSASALLVTGMADRSWQQRYLAWIERETDEASGLLRQGWIGEDRETFFANLAGTFHYCFVSEYLRQPMPAPAAKIDSALRTYADGMLSADREVGFTQGDWAYVLNRATRHTAHRGDEARAALADVAAVTGQAVVARGVSGSMHDVLGVVTTLAELQLAAPGVLLTPQPLRSLLDRRPFL